MNAGTGYVAGSGIKLEFIDANQYTQRYQRNNKRTGLKNLRCFPHCAEEGHKLRGFCGAPVRVQVSNPKRLEIRSWGILTKLPGPEEGLGPDCVELGAVKRLSEIVSLTRCKADPFRPWLSGDGKDGKLIDSSLSDPETIVAFNNARKGWHYSWVANKHTCESQHVMRAYVFEKLKSSAAASDPCFKLIGFADSPAFTIFCRRRQRQNLDRLPVQLKLQLEMQDALKSVGPDGQPVAKMPRAIQLDKSEPKMVHGSEMVLKNKAVAPPSTSAKRKAAAPASQKPKRPRKSKTAAPSLPAKIQPTTYEEKKTLLFHIMRSLLRLDVKTEVPILSTVDSNDVQVYTGSEYDNNPWGIAGDPMDPSNNSGHPAPGPLHVNLSRAGSKQRRSANGSSETFDTKSISDAVDVFSADDSDLMNDAHSIALSASRSNAGLDLPNLNDFEPFDIDFSALGDSADLGNISGPGSRKKNFVEIMKEYAVFLLEEEYFTTTIESALSSLGGSSPDQCKVVAVAVLLDLLKTFLERYNVTLDELFHLFNTQVWDKQSAEVQVPDLSQHEAASAMMKLQEKQIIISRPPPKVKSEREASILKAEAEVAFMEHIAHYTATIREAVTHPSSLLSETASSGLSALGRLASSAVGSNPLSNILSVPRSIPLPGFGAASTTAATFLERTQEANNGVGGASSSLSSSHTAASSSSSSNANNSTAQNKNVTLASLMANTAFAAKPTPSALSPRPLPLIPDNDPINDFTGHYYRPSETLDVLEGIREAIGVPWVLRKMMRYMELDLELSHVPGCLDSQSNRKLLSSGFQRYILDGKQHEWVLPPPIPTERPQRNAFYVATIKGGVLRLELWYNLKKRIVRETRKAPNGQSLESVVLFQFREEISGEWQDKLKARCRALRCEPKKKGGDAHGEPLTQHQHPQIPDQLEPHYQQAQHQMHQHQNSQYSRSHQPVHTSHQHHSHDHSNNSYAHPHNNNNNNHLNHRHHDDASAYYGGIDNDVGWLSTPYDDFALNLT